MSHPAPPLLILTSHTNIKSAFLHISFSSSSFGSIITTVEAFRSLSALLLEHWQALGAIPLPLWLVTQVHTAKVEPLYGTVLVVTPNHFTIGNLQLTRIYFSNCKKNDIPIFVFWENSEAQFRAWMLPAGMCSRWVRSGRPACRAPPGAHRTPHTRSEGLSGSRPVANVD